MHPHCSAALGPILVDPDELLTEIAPVEQLLPRGRGCAETLDDVPGPAQVTRRDPVVAGVAGTSALRAGYRLSLGPVGGIGFTVIATRVNRSIAS